MRSGQTEVKRGNIYGMAVRSHPTDFGDRLRKAREHAGLSRKEVVALLGLGNSTIHDAETLAVGSKHTPRFARLYKVSAHWLATGEGSMLEGADSAPSFALLRLAAVYRVLDPDMRRVLVDTARALYKHARRVTLPAATPNRKRPAETGKRDV